MKLVEQNQIFDNGKLILYCSVHSAPLIFLLIVGLCFNYRPNTENCLQNKSANFCSEHDRKIKMNFLHLFHQNLDSCVNCLLETLNCFYSAAVICVPQTDSDTQVCALNGQHRPAG